MKNLESYEGHLIKTRILTEGEVQEELRFVLVRALEIVREACRAEGAIKINKNGINFFQVYCVNYKGFFN